MEFKKHYSLCTQQLIHWTQYASQKCNDNQELHNHIGAQVGNGTQQYVNGVNESHVQFTDGDVYAQQNYQLYLEKQIATTGEWKIKTTILLLALVGVQMDFLILKNGNSLTDESGNANNFTLGGGTLTKTEDCPSNNYPMFGI